MSRRTHIRRTSRVPHVMALPLATRHFSRRLLLLALAAFGAYALAMLYCATATAKEPAAPQQAAKLPAFKQIEKALDDRFGTNDRELTDLITREQTEQLFAEIDELGWKIRDSRELLARIPSESEFFVRQLLGSKKGRSFMRDVAPMPLGYDRVDRISHLDRGHQFVRDMVKGPYGYKFIEYLTETRYGKNMGRQLQDAPDGAGFNKPTGRIYTAEQLLPVLHEQYNAEKKLRATTASNTK